MLIDWFTVGAQVLNFLILVWLMKRFLYKPILNAIDAREARIARELADADATKAEAEKEREEFQQKNEAFDEQRTALMSKATDEAKGERQRLLNDARQAADSLSAKRQESLANDARNLNRAITRRTQDEVFAIARRTLTDLATTSLEESMTAVFITRLRELNDEAKHILAGALKTAAQPALVRSAFDLPDDQREALQTTLNQTFPADPSTPLRAGVPVRFETAPDLVSGIEFSVNGQKVAWSISDYLSSLEKGVGELLQATSEPKSENAKTKPQPQEAQPAFKDQ